MPPRLRVPRLRLFTETQETKIDEIKTLFSNALLKIQGIASGDPDNLAQHPPTPGAQGLTQPLVGAGADYLHGVHAHGLFRVRGGHEGDHEGPAYIVAFAGPRW